MSFQAVERLRDTAARYLTAVEAWVIEDAGRLYFESCWLNGDRERTVLTPEHEAVIRQLVAEHQITLPWKLDDGRFDAS